MSYKPITPAEFFREIWPAVLLRGESLELRVLQREGNTRRQSFHNSIQDFLEEAEKRNKEIQRAEVYFGVATRHGNNGTKLGCYRVKSIWLDFDSKGIKFSSLPLRPDFVVESGHGYHLYWTLATPILLNPDRVREVEAIHRGLCHKLGGDNAAIDVTRILRVPGFLNHKCNPPKSVRAYKWHTA